MLTKVSMDDLRGLKPENHVDVDDDVTCQRKEKSFDQDQGSTKTQTKDDDPVSITPYPDDVRTVAGSYYHPGFTIRSTSSCPTRTILYTISSSSRSTDPVHVDMDRISFLLPNFSSHLHPHLIQNVQMDDDTFSFKRCGQCRKQWRGDDDA